MRHARKLASALLILVLAVGILPAHPAYTGPMAAMAAARADEPPTFALGTTLGGLIGSISVSYLSADKKACLVTLLLDDPIRVALGGSGAGSGAAEVRVLALNAPPKHDKKRAVVSGTLVAGEALGVPDPAATPCGLNPADVTPYKAARTVAIRNKASSMHVLTTRQLSYAIKPAAAEQRVSWESSDPAVLAVDAAGKLSALEPGVARITARARNGKKATLKVRVTIPTASIALDASVFKLTKGDSRALSAAVAPESASDRRVRWVSSDARIATVSSAGKVKAKRPGAATITATTREGGHAASCLVIVDVKEGGHQPAVTLDGQPLALPFDRAQALEALGARGWTQTSQAGGFSRLASAKYPNTAIRFDPTGAMHALTSEDPGVLVTSRWLTVGSTLRDVIVAGGAPAWHSAEPGAETFTYLLLEATSHGSPLVIELSLERDAVRRIEIRALASPYA